MPGGRIGLRLLQAALASVPLVTAQLSGYWRVGLVGRVLLDASGHDDETAIQWQVSRDAPLLRRSSLQRLGAVAVGCCMVDFHNTTAPGILPCLNMSELRRGLGRTVPGRSRSRKGDHV